MLFAYERPLCARSGRSILLISRTAEDGSCDPPAILGVRMIVPGAREDARLALQVRKCAIPTFAMEAFELPLKMDFVVYRVILPRFGGFEG